MDQDGGSEFSSQSLHSPIPIIYENVGRSGVPKDDILILLDDMENKVENLRKRAFEIEEGRDTMFSVLHAFRHSRLLETLPDVDREEIDRYVERIYNRCSTIDVCVKTVRDKPQIEALYKINGIIDRLITEIQQDPTGSKKKCMSFMNSCTSYSEVGMEDRNFEQALLGCTVDDQKRVRRRLQGLMTYIEKLSMPF
ncbi:UNVERIFIED_CONTAM: hypothetical protein PYX00_000919 [Menopon gallinae]|uniref:BAG family molecular chaperone regulator 2 n=1 Tax=Menopon gallinae TaxID=328185 RepID=A0AAW2IBL7_9NEOP